MAVFFIQAYNQDICVSIATLVVVSRCESYIDV